MVTITNLVFRVFTATLIGIYTIVEVPLSFLVSFGILNLSVKNEAKKPEGVNKKEIILEVSEKEKLLDKGTEDENRKTNLDVTGVNLESLEKGKDTKELEAGIGKKESFLWTASVFSVERVGRHERQNKRPEKRGHRRWRKEREPFVGRTK